MIVQATPAIITRMLKAGYKPQVETCLGVMPTQAKAIKEVLSGKAPDEALTTETGAAVLLTVDELFGQVVISAGNPPEEVESA